MKNLPLRVFKRLNNAMMHTFMLIDDSPKTNCLNHWSQAIHYATYAPMLNFDDKFLLGSLLE